MHFCDIYIIKTLIRLNGGSTKNDQTYTTDRVNNADFRNDPYFFVTSSRPIKAEPKGLKSTLFWPAKYTRRKRDREQSYEIWSPYFSK